MRFTSKASCAIGILAAIALTASAADARPHHTTHHAPYAYEGAYDAVGGANHANEFNRSVPYDAGGVAYAPGQRTIDSSNDFQLQGR
jgi:hypothetical protein